MKAKVSKTRTNECVCLALIYEMPLEMIVKLAWDRIQLSLKADFPSHILECFWGCITSSVLIHWYQKAQVKIFTKTESQKGEEILSLSSSSRFCQRQVQSRSCHLYVCCSFVVSCSVSGLQEASFNFGQSGNRKAIPLVFAWSRLRSCGVEFPFRLAISQMNIEGYNRRIPPPNTTSSGSSIAVIWR